MSLSTKKLADRYNRQHKGEGDIDLLPDLFSRDSMYSVVCLTLLGTYVYFRNRNPNCGAPSLKA